MRTKARLAGPNTYIRGALFQVVAPPSTSGQEDTQDLVIYLYPVVPSLWIKWRGGCRGLHSKNKSRVSRGSTQRPTDPQIAGVGRGPHALGKNAITVIFCMCTNWRIACQDVHLQSEACRGIIAPIRVCRQNGGRAVKGSTCRSVLRCSQPNTTQVDKVTWQLSRAALAACVHQFKSTTSKKLLVDKMTGQLSTAPLAVSV